MAHDLIAKINENKYDNIKDSRGSKVHDQNDSSMSQVREDDNGMDVDEEADNGTEDDDDEDTDQEEGEKKMTKIPIKREEKKSMREMRMEKRKRVMKMRL